MGNVYDEAYGRSLRDPQGFWAAVAEDIHWERRWDRVTQQPCRCPTPRAYRDTVQRGANFSPSRIAPGPFGR